MSYIDFNERKQPQDRTIQQYQDDFNSPERSSKLRKLNHESQGSQQSTQESVSNMIDGRLY